MTTAKSCKRTVEGDDEEKKREKSSRLRVRWDEQGAKKRRRESTFVSERLYDLKQR